MKEQRFILDGRKKERIVFQSRMLHYGLYMPEPKGGVWLDIPWHWHDEFEFGYLSGGSILYKTNHSEFTLREGDGIFINSGILHNLKALKPASEVRLTSQFFDSSFLAGTSGSIYDIKYIKPVKECRTLDAMPLYRDCEGNARFLDQLRRCGEISRKEEPFFELRIRSLFSELWETVYSWAEKSREDAEGYDQKEDERIKKMLAVIGENYSEKITAAELARAVHISERECYRIFQEILGITPGKFIISIRLQKAQELLGYSDKGISEIAAETGFGTGSYFCKMFKAYHHITPKEYRKLFTSPRNPS